VIALHRRQWTTNCFETYLRARWEGDLKQASWELNRHIAAKGKQPTAKQFLGFGADTTNRWFGGDLGDAYAAMGEKSPVAQQRVDLMPSNRFGFAQLVFERMGGKATTQQERFRTERASQLEERLGDIPVALQMGPIQPDRGNWTLQRLADQAPKYVQLTEALDRPPTAKELGVERWLEERDGLGTLWPQYVSVIEAVLDEARALAPWRRAESVPANPQPPPTSPIQAAPISSPSSFVTGASATSKKSLLKRLFGR
jgi:hypothetical protein